MPHLRARPGKDDRADRPRTWEIVYDLPLGPDRKRRQETETFHGIKGDAEERMRAKQAEIDRAGSWYVQPMRMTVAELMDRWLTEFVRVKRRPSTVASYEDLVRKWITPKLGTLTLADLVPAVIQDWVDDMSANGKGPTGKPISARRVAYARAVLRSSLSWAVRTKHWVPYNPVTQTNPPPATPKRVAGYSLTQARAIQDVAVLEYLGPMFNFLWLTGVRIGESVALTWADVDLDEQSLVIRKNVVEVHGKKIEQDVAKTAHGDRVLALTAPAVRCLEAQSVRLVDLRASAGVRWQENNLVWPSPTGLFVNYRTALDAWYRIVERAGVPRYTPHQLRHTWAGLAIQAGVGMREVADNLGHSDPGFTARVYGGVLDETRRQAARRLGRLIESGNVTDDA